MMQTHPLNGHHTARSFVLVGQPAPLVLHPPTRRPLHTLAIFRGIDRLTYRAIMRGRTQRKDYTHGNR